jgi:hypothetical protein
VFAKPGKDPGQNARPCTRLEIESIRAVLHEVKRLLRYTDDQKAPNSARQGPEMRRR